MKKTCALMLMLLMYIPSVLSSPAYAASHIQDENTSKSLEAANDDKKKNEGQKEEEEPDCD